MSTAFEEELGKAKVRRVLWTIEAYLSFLFVMLWALWKVIISNFAKSVSKPITTGLWLFSFLVINITGFLLVTTIGIFYLTRMNFVLDFIRKTWGEGFSMTNMDNPHMFEENTRTVLEAINVLDQALDCPEVSAVTKKDKNIPLPDNDVHEEDKEVDDEAKNETDGERIRYFDMDVAKTLLLMSAATYERDEIAIAKLIVQKEAARQIPDLIERRVELARIAFLERKTWKKIREIGAKWGVEFKGVSDLNTYGGAYCGFWWKPGGNWIVLSFKGTSPLSGVEWLTDLTYVKTTASAFLAGHVHKGFYSQLFPNPENDDSFSPYGQIVRKLISLADKMRASHDDNGIREKINVYVTGHSLGSAIATLFYARARKSPKDFSENIRICNAYIYGTPNTGDVEYLAGYYSHHNVPFFDYNMLYRIVNRYDIVCRIPAGVAEQPLRRDYMERHDVFNFGHTGEEIYISGTKTAHFEGNQFAPPVEVRVVGEDKSKYKGGEPLTIGKQRVFSLDSFPPSLVLFALAPSFVTETNPLVFTMNAFTYPITLGRYVISRFSGKKDNAEELLKKLDPIPFMSGFTPNFLADHAPSGYLKHLNELKPTPIRVSPEHTRAEYRMFNKVISEAIGPLIGGNAVDHENSSVNH